MRPLNAAGMTPRIRTFPSTPWAEQAHTRGPVQSERAITAIDTLERAVAGAAPWITGARFTAADVYVGAQVIWGQMFESMPERPVFLD